jgi:hypothetical protein
VGRRRKWEGGCWGKGVGESEEESDKSWEGVGIKWRGVREEEDK